MAVNFKKVNSLFSTTLAVSMTSSQTTMQLQAVPTGDIEYPNWFVIDPDGANAEIVYCPSGPSSTTFSSVVRGVAKDADTDTAGTGIAHPANVTVVMAPVHRQWNSICDILYGNANMPGVPLLPASRVINSANQVVDKQYADTIPGAGLFGGFLVTKHGSSPTTSVDIASGQYIKKDRTNANYAGTSALALTTSNTNYIELDPATGTASANTVGFTTGRFPLASAVVSGTDITSLTDLRAVLTMNDGVVDQIRTWATAQTITAQLLQLTSDPSGNNDPVRFSYLTTALQQNIGVLTAGATIAVGNALYVKASDGKVYPTDTAADESVYSFVGIAISAGSASASITFVKPGGIASGLSGLTAGNYYFINGTGGSAGAIANTADSTRYAKIGQALSTTTLRVCEPKFVRKGSQSLTSVTTFVQTTGFYPAVIIMRAASAGEGTRTPGLSWGDDSNTDIFYDASLTQGNDGYETHAWKCVNSSGKVNQGTVSAVSQTGFTLSCATHDINATVQWIAFSE